MNTTRSLDTPQDLPEPDTTLESRSRRAALAPIGLILGAPFILSSESRAQATWPNRPIKYINPFPAGGATDTLSRLFCVKMSELSGQQWIVENHGGGGGDIGVTQYMRAEPNGYTLGLGGIASHAISPTLKAGKLPFDAAKDFTFITNIWSLPNFLVTNANLPANTLPELIELLKKNPAKYSYASAGLGTTLHLCGELFKLLAGVDMLHVPYRGAAPGMIDVMGGQVHMIFDNIPGALVQYRPGKVKGMGVTSAKRSPIVPDIPAIAEFLPGFDVSSWTSLAGPAGIPPAIVERISMFAKQALESESLKKDFFERGATTFFLPPLEAVAYRASEEKRLGDIIRRANITLD